MNYYIRTMKPEDMEAVVELYILAYADDVWSEKWQQKAVYNRISEITLSPEAVSLVYIEDNEIRGCILCTLMSWHTGKQLEIRELFINPLHQNRGIGLKLMTQIEAMIPELDVSELFLWTKGDIKLVNFYKKCGYGIVDDTVQMIKRIRR